MLVWRLMRCPCAATETMQPGTDGGFLLRRVRSTRVFPPAVSIDVSGSTGTLSTSPPSNAGTPVDQRYRHKGRHAAAHHQRIAHRWDWLMWAVLTPSLDAFPHSEWGLQTRASGEFTVRNPSFILERPMCPTSKHRMASTQLEFRPGNGALMLIPLPSRRRS